MVVFSLDFMQISRFNFTKKLKKGCPASQRKTVRTEQPKQKTSISSRHPCETGQLPFQGSVTRIYLGLTASSEAASGRRPWGTRDCRTPGEGELLRPLDFTNALTTVAPRTSGEALDQPKGGWGVCIPTLIKPSSVHSSHRWVQEWARVSHGPSAGSRLPWSYQESNAGCGESRREIWLWPWWQLGLSGGRENEELKRDPKETGGRATVVLKGKESGGGPWEICIWQISPSPASLAMSSDLQASWETSVCISHDRSSFLY